MSASRNLGVPQHQHPAISAGELRLDVEGTFFVNEKYVCRVPATIRSQAAEATLTVRAEGSTVELGVERQVRPP